MPYVLRIDRREIDDPPTKATCVLEVEVPSAQRLSEIAGEISDRLAERMTPEEAARVVHDSIVRTAINRLRV